MRRNRPTLAAAPTLALTLALALALAVALVATGITGAAPQRATATAPNVTTEPAIAGAAQVGSTLTATTGSWTGDTPLTYAFTWLRCNGSGNACTAIAGATSQSYLLVVGDLAATLRVSVVAVNGAGAGGGVSAPSAAVASAPSAPTSSVAPTISGTVRQGQVLTASPGTWTGTGTITYTYQWKRCDTAGQACADASSVIAQNTITLAAADVGKTIRAVVIATTGAGSASATSAPSPVVLSTNAPALTTLPTVSGVAREGETLTATAGTWAGSGLTYTYKWRRCDAAGENCVDASAPTAQSTVTLVLADTAKTLRVVVTATSSGGVATATSEPTQVIVKKDTPANTGVPTLTGTAREGQVLTIANGVWSATGTVAYTYQWKRCDTAGQACTDASSVIGQNTITLAVADIGKTIRAVVIATNAVGSATATTAATLVVAAKDAPAPPTGGTLPPGTGPLTIAQVASPNRLVMTTVTPVPARIMSRSVFVLRVKVTDAQGRPVEGAVVAALPLPTAWARGGKATTGVDGHAAIEIRPTAKLPLAKGVLSVFLQSTKPGDDAVLKVSGARIAQIRIG